MSTPHLVLASAAGDLKAGLTLPHKLEGNLTPAQVGSTYRLLQAEAIQVSEEILNQVKDIKFQISFEISSNPIYASQVLSGIKSIDELESTLGVLLKNSTDQLVQTKIGYWLMSIFLRGLSFEETNIFTKFLTDNVGQTNSKIRKSVRRYPTGGISEKQALILPAFLRYVAKTSAISSSFLIARRLAHTGGTRDKLSILPGFSFPAVGDLQEWNSDKNPIQYFTASSSFCFRDSELYRIRGETGTVAELGLMASSIMAKQVSFPADIIVLDILYGENSFLKSLSDAEHFSSICQGISEYYSLTLIPFFRESLRSNGQCIGNVLEVFEAVSLISPNPDIFKKDAPEEIKTAINFLKLFANYLPLNFNFSEKDILEAWQSGDIFKSLCNLWVEHGVDQDFIDRLSTDGPNFLISNLSEVPIKSKKTGKLSKIFFLEIADITNNIINSYKSSNDLKFIPSKGGIRILKNIGENIQEGDILAYAYTENELETSIYGKLENMFDVR